jgi:transcriptional regulator with XRE-family HTH domain
MSKCDVCGSALESRRTTRETPYAYVIGGLPRVGLVGIIVRRCPTCMVDAPVIPKPGQLHQLLAKMFLHKAGPLAGDELRFLRKHAGLTAQTFAELLGIDPSHLSRVENGKTDSLGLTADRYARAIVSAALDVHVKDVILKALDNHKTLRRPLMKLNKMNRWQEDEAA